MKFEYTKIKQNAFNEIKRIVPPDTLLNYPGFKEEFKIHTNDSNFQLGAFISQTGKPVAFYSGRP